MLEDADHYRDNEIQQKEAQEALVVMKSDRSRRI